MGGWILVFILHFQVLFGCHQMATEIRLAQQDSAETAQFQLLSWLKGLEELCKGCLPTKQKKKKEKKKQADVILSSPGTSTLAVFEVGCLRTVKEWGRTGPPRLAGLVARRRVDVPARTALSLGWLCRCVLRDPETKIARGEFGTGVEVDDQALGKPRGAS